MKKFKFISISKYIENGKISFQRFPLAMVFACLFALVGIYSNHQTANRESFFYLSTSLPLQMVLVLGFFLAIAINLANKSLHRIWVKADNTWSLVLYTLGLGILLAMYVSLWPIGEDHQSKSLIFTYIGVLLATIVACTFLGRLGIRENFEAYVAHILKSEIIALIYTIVLYGCLGAVFLALNYLLGLTISGEVYSDLFYILFAPVQAGFFLTGFPEGDLGKIENEEDKPPVFILQKLLTPLLLTYTLILYVYFIKMFMTGEVPSNTIRKLFIWYGVVSVVSVFFHSRYMENPVSKWMVTRFPYFVLPTIGVYLYALILRIQDVGFTEFRYLGLTFGIYLIVSLVIFIWQKGRDNRILGMVLVVFLLLASVGPQSMAPVSRRSQEKRLTSYLLTNNMLVDGKIVANKKVKQEDRREITSIVSYLVDNYEMSSVRYLPKGFTMDNFDQLFGFLPEGSYEGVAKDDEGGKPGIDYYFFNSQAALDIEGYNQYYLLNFSNNPNTDQKKFRYFSVKEDEGEMVISKKDGDRYEEMIRLPLREISGKYKALTSAGPMQNPNDLSFEGRARGLDYRLVFTSLSVDQEEKNYYMEMALLIREAK